MIELQNIECIFSDGFASKKEFVAVSPMSMCFKQGERYAIVGESGSGKTTLARMIAGLQKPSGGKVVIEGRSVYEKKRKAKAHFKNVQIVQQNTLSALDPKMTIGKIIEEPLGCFFHYNRQERKKRCEGLMQICNLPLSYYTRLPNELSGGQQKRVAIARALAVEPRCLIFDEATNGFDMPLRKKITEEIIHLQENLGFTLIFITHDIELAMVVANEILVMKQSHILERVMYGNGIWGFKDEYSKLLLEASGINNAGDSFMKEYLI